VQDNLQMHLGQFIFFFFNDILFAGVLPDLTIPVESMKAEQKYNYDADIEKVKATNNVDFSRYRMRLIHIFYI
jgi:hypothetical protein